MSESARLTVLGRCSPFPGTNGHCPGYLLEGGGRRVLIDCGPGTLAGLTGLGGAAGSRPVAPPTTASPFIDLDAVVLSHLHADHFSEVLSLRYAVAADIRDGYRRDRLPVYLPPEPEAERDIIDYPAALELRTITEESRLDIGPFHFKFRRTAHPLHCLAMRVAVEAERGPGAERGRDHPASLVYTADTPWDDGLVDWSAGAGLLLIEASLQEATAHLRHLGHLTAREAGRFGASARARRTVLVHLYPQFDLETSRREAEEGFAEGDGTGHNRVKAGGAQVAGQSPSRPIIPAEGDAFPL